MPHHPRFASPILIAATLAASACAFQTGPTRPPAEAAAVSACRTRADEVFERQNRDHAYRVDVYRTDTRDAPFASSGMRGVTSAGLPQRFGRDTTMDECLRASGYGATPPESRNIHGNLPAGH